MTETGEVSQGEKEQGKWVELGSNNRIVFSVPCMSSGTLQGIFKFKGTSRLWRPTWKKRTGNIQRCRDRVRFECVHLELVEIYPAGAGRKQERKGCVQCTSGNS